VRDLWRHGPAVPVRRAVRPLFMLARRAVPSGGGVVTGRRVALGLLAAAVLAVLAGAVELAAFLGIAAGAVAYILEPSHDQRDARRRNGGRS